MVKKRIARDTAKARAAKSAAAKAAATARARTLEKVELASATAPGRQLNGFLEFMRAQGVVGLAIGLVFGVQIKALVDQIIASFINPILGLALPGQGDLAKKTFSLTVGDKVAVFSYGAFIAVLLSFITVAAVVYFIIKGLKLDKLDKKKEK
jgi:large conductance mechanosensitive channel